MTLHLPPLPTDWEPTRATLHAYARRLRALAGAFAEPHPHYWHLALAVKPTGLETAALPLVEGGDLRARLDIRRHLVTLEVAGAEAASLDLTGNVADADLDSWLEESLAVSGLDASPALRSSEFGEVAEYDPVAAEAFWDVLCSVAEVFEIRRRAMEGEVGPLHLWPHGFDASFEWFGAAQVDGGEQPQINVGFFPGAPAYFYSNPFPFHAGALLRHPLPHGAEWHTAGWEGSILPYDRLAADPDSERKLLEYLEAVSAAALRTFDH